MINLLLNEIKQFSKQNWWIYILFILSLIIIHITNSGNLLEISLVFIAHFLGDLCIMLMGNYLAGYQKTKNKKYEKFALFSQFGSIIIFGLIGIYAGIWGNEWAYFIPQVLFIWPFLQGTGKIYNIELLKKINYKLIGIVGIIVMFIYFFLGLIHNLGNIIQVLGFIIFPLGLAITNRKLQYSISTIGIGLIFLGSLYQMVIGILNGHVLGTDLSYTLLPFVVFLFYLKNIKTFIK